MRQGGPRGSWGLKEQLWAARPELGGWGLAFHRAFGGEPMDGLASGNPPHPPAMSGWGSVLVMVSREWGPRCVFSSLNRVFPPLGSCAIVSPPPEARRSGPSTPAPSGPGSLNDSHTVMVARVLNPGWEEKDEAGKKGFPAPPSATPSPWPLLWWGAGGGIRFKAAVLEDLVCLSHLLPHT